MKTRLHDRTPSVEPQDQAQPQKRTSRKRRASSPSETPSLSASQETSSQVKRRKKTKSTTLAIQDEHPQLDPLDEETAEEQDTATQSKHVRFDQDAAEDAEKSTAAFITPHFRKQTHSHRRMTLSPADLRNGIKPSLNTKSRVSLPLNLTPGEEIDVDGPEIDFVSLSDLINERLHQRLEQKKNLFQVDGSDEMETEEDMMIYNGHENGTLYPKLPTPSAKRISHVQREEHTIIRIETEANAADDKADRERAAFEDAIKRLTREASDAKAALQILTIEVQSLGFGSSDSSVEIILSSIRDSFLNIRERLEAAVPGQVPENVSNVELVDFVIERVISLADHVESQQQVIETNDQIGQELVNEINGLVDRLADAEIRKGRLETANGEFEVQGQDDDKYIRDMEARLHDIEKEHGNVALLLAQREKQYVGLQKDNANLEENIKKLGKALDNYRSAEDKLHAIITRMEEEHKAALIKAENGRVEQVEDLEFKLREETTMRSTAEADADDKQTIITDLEVRFEEVSNLLENYKQQLVEMQEAELAERTAKEQAEEDRDEKATFISELEARIEQAEADLGDTQNELSQLRDLSESERRQREAAETDLDEANANITNLEAKLHKHGVEANELRQKLFEVQLREKTSIKKLEDLASEREEQYQNDMGDEIARREAAEALASERGALIGDLKDQLAAVEESMRQTVAELTDEIDRLTEQVVVTREQNKTADAKLEDAAQKYQDLKYTTGASIAELGVIVNSLQTKLASHEAKIADMESTARTTAVTHATAIEDRDTQIANLNHDIYQAHEQIEVLEKDKTSLERRVEGEAEAMLELQSSKDDEIADLKATIRAKQDEVQDLGEKAIEVDQAWNNLMREKDTEILEIEGHITERSVVINKLYQQNLALKERFRQYVRDSIATTDAMNAEIEAARDAAAGQNRDLNDKGRLALEEIEGMETASEITETAVQHSAVKKVKKSKKGTRTFDSGIGVAEGSPLV